MEAATWCVSLTGDIKMMGERSNALTLFATY